MGDDRSMRAKLEAAARDALARLDDDEDARRELEDTYAKLGIIRPVPK